MLSFGSNIGDKAENIKKAYELLETEKLNIIKDSKLYITKAYGVTNQPDFHNSVALCKTCLTPIELLNFIKKIEKNIGRYETFRWGPRVIDIDIIFYDNIKYDSEDLTIPHKDFRNREFVITPIRDILPYRLKKIWNIT